jgi:hypothetical protein
VFLLCAGGHAYHGIPKALLGHQVAVCGIRRPSSVELPSVVTFSSPLCAGGHAYHGIPKALLGHQVAVCGLRPAFPDFAPSEYRALAEACWQADPEKRCVFLYVRCLRCE